MHVLKFGRHRLNVTIRLDRIPPGAEAERAYHEQCRKLEALALREHWEHDMSARIGWVR